MNSLKSSSVQSRYRCVSGSDSPGGIERLSGLTGLPYWAARANHSIGYLSRNELRITSGITLPAPSIRFLEIILQE
jgi:hypothetical protein